MKRFRCSAFTLIELLVVIVIITTITASVIPIMLPIVESRRIREASRGVNTFIVGARALAVSKQRLAGVEIRRLSNELGAAMHMQYVQVPPPYSGDLINSTFSVKLFPANQVNPASYVVRVEWSNGTFNRNLVKPGDQVQLGFHKEVYEVSVVNGSYIDLRIKNNGLKLPWPDHPSSTAKVPYRIMRIPAMVNSKLVTSKASRATYDLPEGMVIDLVGSGIGDGQFPGNKDPVVDTSPVVILFSPTGAIDSIWANGTKIRPLGAVHLLIGKRENVPAAKSVKSRKNVNWLDPANFWVSIGHQTGQISTAEVALEGNNFLEARRFARERLSMGGR